MIGFALFAAPHFNPPVMALAWAVVVGEVTIRLSTPAPKKSACWYYLGCRYVIPVFGG